jgi:uncharacterized phage-associated protein
MIATRSRVVSPLYTVNSEKLREAICFFARKGGKELGKTKLMKLLYFADFGYFREYGRPITGATYYKWPMGPVATDAIEEIETLVRDGVLEKHNEPAVPRPRQCLLDCGQIDTDHLDTSEIEMLEKVWRKWKPASARSIVTASHTELPWQVALPNKKVLYEYAITENLPF